MTLIFYGHDMITVLISLNKVHHSLFRVCMLSSVGKSLRQANSICDIDGGEERNPLHSETPHTVETM